MSPKKKILLFALFLFSGLLFRIPIIEDQANLFAAAYFGHVAVHTEDKVEKIAYTSGTLTCINAFIEPHWLGLEGNVGLFCICSTPILTYSLYLYYYLFKS